MPAAFVERVGKLETELQMLVWLLVQNSDYPWGQLSGPVYTSFFNGRFEMQPRRKIALLLDSPGGDAGIAYRLAKLFRRHCGGFTVVIPGYAKSAATLLSLGADRVILGEHAELGPLDAQETDVEEGQVRSVLNNVQTLERLNAFALRSLDEAMQLLLRRTGLRMKALLPFVIDLTGNLVRPLMENIDVVRHTEASRILKVAEAYAIRLLRSRYNEKTAEEIARALVERYPEHGFVIDSEELNELGLKVELPSGSLAATIGDLRLHTDKVTAIGKINEVSVP